MVSCESPRITVHVGSNPTVPTNSKVKRTPLSKRRIRVRCARGPREGMKRVRERVFSGQLDLQILICTRGRDFPLTMLESRPKCPRCGSRRVRLTFILPLAPVATSV